MTFSIGPGSVTQITAPGAAGSVTVDAVGTEQKSAAGQTSFGFTGLSIIAGNAMTATVTFGGASVPSPTATWGAQSMTLLAIQDGPFSGSTTAIFGLRNPVAGNQTLTVGSGGVSVQIMVDAISFAGANVSSDATAFPVAGRTASPAGPTNSPSLAVTSATGHIAVCAISNQGNNFSAPTPGTSMFIDNAGASVNAAAQYASGAATINFGWSSSASEQFAIVAADVSP